MAFLPFLPAPLLLPLAYADSNTSVEVEKWEILKKTVVNL
jgi:hypothetical protein